MKLLYTPIKSYTHTVEAVIAYAGVAALIEPVPTRPFDADPRLHAANPLSTVPVLIDDGGNSLYGGPVIYEYLDSLHGDVRLYPTGDARWQVLRQAWLADAVFDATVRLIVESWEKPQRPAFVERTWAKILRGLDAFERNAVAFDGLTIGQLRAVGALAFLDLKISAFGATLDALDPHFEWRTGRPALAAWYARVVKNPIFRFNLVSVP